MAGGGSRGGEGCKIARNAALSTCTQVGREGSRHHRDVSLPLWLVEASQAQGLLWGLWGERRGVATAGLKGIALEKGRRQKRGDAD